MDGRRKGVLAAGLLPAIAGIWGAAASAADAVVDISVVMPFGSMGGQPKAEELIAQFEAANPGIHVTLQNGAGPKLLSRIAAGDPPDVGTVDYGQAPGFYQKGLATDLTPYLERDKFDTSVLPPNDESLKYQGKWYGVPQAGGAFADRAIFYDRDAFGAAGLAFPTPEWTWTDFATDAKKLTTDPNGDGKPDRVGYSFSNLEWPIYVWSGGGDIFKKQADGYVFALDQEPAEAALDWWAELTKAGVAATNPAINFKTGKVAMGTGAYFQVQNFANQKLPFDWSLITFPNGAGGSINRRITHPWVIPAGAKHPDEAWRFLKFWLSDAVQHELTIDWRVRPPQIRPIAQELARLQLAGPPYSYAAFMGVTGASRALPIAVPGWDKISPEIDKAILPIWQGRVSAKSAMDALAPTINAMVQAATEGS
ncbi:MAG TPA: sugar ABC transporter substrate-binding protein [Limnochordia bacterium]|nr:sugar ABC transporter substrate-binding protein [Limnochordia bacterium]